MPESTRLQRFESCWRYHRYRDHKDSFVRGAWYFSDGWPLNFWSHLHPRKVKRELHQIRDMGFNTVFIVIPWRGFQPDIESAQINRDWLLRARRFLRQCARLKLKVYARVSYGHAMHDDSQGGIIARTEALLTRPDVLDHWLAYLSALNSLSRHSALAGFFLCWEDFWHTLIHFQQRDLQSRERLAETIGYQEFLCAAGTSSVQALQPVPEPGSSSQPLYFDFMNWRIRQLFERAADVISPLSMEVRVDRDACQSAAGESVWHQHDQYHDVLLPSLTYWAPFMGSENEGEILSASDGIGLFSFGLKQQRLQSGESAPILNQFNFIDRTPKFLGQHAQLADEAVAPFLQACDLPLLDYTNGYALWALRNYVQNLLYNAAFALGDEGWLLSGTSRLVSTRLGPAMRLAAGGTLEQTFTPSLRGMGWINQADKLWLTLDVVEKNMRGSIEVELVGHDRVTLDATDSLHQVRLQFQGRHEVRKPMILRIRVDGAPVTLTRICLYHYEFDNDVLDLWGDDGVCAQEITQLNQRLRDQRRRAYAARRSSPE